MTTSTQEARLETPIFAKEFSILARRCLNLNMVRTSDRPARKRSPTQLTKPLCFKHYWLLMPALPNAQITASKALDTLRWFASVAEGIAALIMLG